MVGAGHVLAFCLLVALPSSGYLVAVRNGTSGLLGVGAGLAAFVAVLSGNFLRVLVLDFFERKRHPIRKGVGGRVTAVAVLVFAASLAVCFAFYRHVSR